MFGLNLFGVSAIDKNNLITVSGLNGYTISHYFERFWKTSVIGTHMFNKMTAGRYGRLEFHSFFAVEVAYMLDTLIASNKPNLPIRTLSKISEAIKRDTWLKDINKDIPGVLDFKRLELFNYKPLPFQQNWLNYYNKTPTQYRLNGALLNGASGSGKGLDLNTLIRVPNGWKKIGDLKLGDIVNAPNGDATRVNGIFDNNDKRCFEITFVDDRTCVCDEDHLWEVYKIRKRSKWMTLSTLELIDEMERQKQRQLSKGVPEDKVYYDLRIPLVDPTHSADLPVELPLDPYVLGVILGDGTVDYKGDVRIAKPDLWMLHEVTKLLFGNFLTTSITNTKYPKKCLSYRIARHPGYNDKFAKERIDSIQSIMKDLGLNGKRSWEKFIPEVYMNASFGQRLALIQGLMDTDGCANDPSKALGRNGQPSRCGNIEWATTSETLADQMVELLRSVGCIVKKRERITKYTVIENGVKVRKPGRVSYRLNIRAQIPDLLFRTPVKKEKVSGVNQYSIKGLKLRIKSIKEVPSVLTRCISVDHPDKLYIIKDYIVTHNTTMTMFTQVLTGVDKIIVVCPKNAIHRVWYDDIQRMFKTPPKIWNSSMPGAPSEDTFLRIYHYEALDRVMVDNEDLFDKYTFGLVLDESHNFNDVKSQRTQRWLELCKASGSRHIIHASGTPFKAMGSESIPLFRAIDPLFTPQVEERFKKIFGHSAQRGLDILKHRLGLTSFVIKKEELGLEKPEMITYSVKIPNGRDYTLAKVKEAMRVYIEERFEYYAKRADEDLAFYKACLETHGDIIRGDRQKQAEFDKYKRDIAAIQEADKYSDYSSVKEEIMYCKRYEFTEISKSLPQNQVKAFRSVCSVIKYLKLKIQGECLGNVVGRMRIEAHRAMVKGIRFLEICESTEKKTVVFTSFVDVLEDSMNECKNQGLTPLLVYGKTNNDLNGIIRKFEKEEALNPLIATYDSLSTAVPLVMADTMIMVNAPFRSYIQDQAIARIHRLNQTSKTRVYQCYLDTGNEPNISTRSLDIMQWSQQQVEAMTGVKSPYTIDDTTLGMHVSAEGFDESLSFRLGEDTTPPRVSKVNSTFNLTTGSNVAKW